MPDTLGLSLDPKERATVKAVAAGSAGEKAGFKSGDRIVKLEGQPILSCADVQWVLHTTADPGQVKAEVDRGGKVEVLTLPLVQGWRRAGDFTWRASLWELSFSLIGARSMALPAPERKKLGLADTAFALRVAHVQAPGKTSLQKDDVILDIDGQKTIQNENEFLAYLAQAKKPGAKVKLTVLRSGQRKEHEMPLP